MTDHVLLNLLKEFNKFNNTRPPMLDSIYHMTLRLLVVKRFNFVLIYMQHCYGCHN